ncbi:DUF4132 domain-containing protein [Streptacidiphilus jiangxiensis]|uniref:Uncharacterized protein n=1 Tax=Streptacidiphilus jiangxiensis TaxID=235985 RepID=A0A1H7QHH6_STRJI|nr:DUF4132 domain-containing protein [Streptacidiphilus jiangxiensis]SEL47393.1 protein of unknown function [Streptacidiphilus jiangxiensis]
MIDAAPVAGIPDNSVLDAVRAAALARLPWLADFLTERLADPRDGFTPWPGDAVHTELRARKEAGWAEVGRRLAVLPEEELRAAVIAVVTCAELHHLDQGPAREVVAPLVPLIDGWTTDEVGVLLRHACARRCPFHNGQDLALALDAAARLDADGCRAVTPWLRRAHEEAVEFEQHQRDREQLLARLQALLGRADGTEALRALIPAQALWAAPLRDEVDRAPTPAFAALVDHLRRLSSPRPTQRWRRTCVELTDAVSGRVRLTEVLRSMAEDEPLCSERSGPHDAHMGAGYHYHYLVRQDDGDLARGLVWAAALTGGAAAVPHLTALALRVGLRGGGVFEDPKLAGAAVNALAGVEDESALEALWRLQARIKNRGLRKQVDTALVTAAERLGVTPEQLVERSVPHHGLAPDGSVERVVAGGHRIRLAIEYGKAVRVTFTAPDGRVSRTAPAVVKEQSADELTAMKALAKEVRSTLSSERARLEALLSTERTWPHDDWRRHYRDHPVTGVLTRGLIWEFADAKGVWTAAAPGTGPARSAVRVRLWHPLRASVDDIRAWRERIVADELRQPFKQAFREVYLLTPAEVETGTYSNRFAGHIVHYQRLYALMKERGWQATYLSNHDGGFDGEARAVLAGGAWRVWFHHQPADLEFRYSPDHATTDQVRFDRRVGRRWEPAPVAEVPAAVFSEAMRDVDLFVSVTSIAADPTWSDRGEDRHSAYWHAASTAELTASALVRREVLGRIVPRLRIAGRCVVEARHLVVRGELATYRIHLGSANVVMEPSGAYVCIVPSAGAGAGRVFLPFEDERLSLILSKALLLANDTRITDESILAQIRRGA